MRKRKELVSTPCNSIDAWLQLQATQQVQEETWGKPPTFYLNPLLHSLYRNLDLYKYQKVLDQILVDSINKQDLAKFRLLADLLEQEDSPSLQQVAQGLLNKYRTEEEQVKSSCVYPPSPAPSKRENFLRHQKQRKSIRDLIASKPFPIEKLTPIQVDKKAQSQYLDAYCADSPLGALQQARVKEILASLRLISPQEFSTLFQSSLDQLVEGLNGQHWSPGAIKEGKSNLWLLQNALSYSPQLAKTMVVDETKQGLLDYQGVYNIVFFDDIVYSGKQMGENVSDVFDAPHVSPSVHIWVVVTMITKKGMATILDAVTKAVEKKLLVSAKHLHLIFQELLNPNIPSPEIQEEALKYKDFRDSSSMEPLLVPNYSVILPFKMADNLSSFPEVFWGYIPPLPKNAQTSLCPQRQDSQFIPYLKGCEALFSRGYRIARRHPPSEPSAMIYSTVECPRPPYKDLAESRDFLVAPPENWETGGKKIRGEQPDLPMLIAPPYPPPPLQSQSMQLNEID